MASFRIRLMAQDIALKALDVAASAGPNKEIAAELAVIRKQLAKRFGVPAGGESAA
jgi:hypothetical protein